MDEKEKIKKMEALLKRLVDIDWCIGYELTIEQMSELDDIRTAAYALNREQKSIKNKTETQPKIAHFIRDLNRTQKLYRLSPPLSDLQWDDEEEIEKAYEYVVVSATYVAFGGPETYIFGSNKDGEILSCFELPGSFQGGIDHERALKNAGYTVGTIPQTV